ncbi:hypothetical protein BV20DRAFT_384920 [Pilatotrama ljubarskyi]|nr:hypothetical protein BV20DRAFT_384920 [Pilatotrama ljubarskyi]
MPMSKLLHLYGLSTILPCIVLMAWQGIWMYAVRRPSIGRTWCAGRTTPTSQPRCSAWIGYPLLVFCFRRNAASNGPVLSGRCMVQSLASSAGRHICRISWLEFHKTELRMCRACSALPGMYGRCCGMTWRLHGAMGLSSHAQRRRHGYMNVFTFPIVRGCG